MENDFEVRVKNSGETAALAGKLSKILSKGDIVLLDGDLGAGKTFFASRLISAMGVEDSVVSPTFTIVREYENKTRIFHADLYRVSEKEFVQLGYDDLMGKDGITIVEWGGKLKGILKDYLYIKIEIVSPEERTFFVAGAGKRSAEIAREWKIAYTGT